MKKNIGYSIETSFLEDDYINIINTYKPFGVTFSKDPIKSNSEFNTLFQHGKNYQFKGKKGSKRFSYLALKIKSNIWQLIRVDHLEVGIGVNDISLIKL